MRQRVDLSPIGAKPRIVWEYLRTLRDEMEAWRQADMIGTVTEEDLEAMLDTDPDLEALVIPDGFDHLAIDSAAPPDTRMTSGPNVVFVANFAYQPNLDAARYLCREIMPGVLAHEPGCRLFLVGNAPARDLTELDDERVVVTGRVPRSPPISARQMSSLALSGSEEASR